MKSSQLWGSLLVFALLALGMGGMWWRRPAHRPVEAVVAAPRPVVKPAPAPVHPQWQPRLAAERHRLDRAEAVLLHYVPSPPQGSEEGGGPEDSELVQEKAAEEAVESSLAAEVSGRAYADQGEIQLRKNDYDRAVDYFTRAFQIAPKEVVVQVGLERSWHGQRIAKLIRPLLPSGQTMKRLLPFTVPRHLFWAVLSCNERNAENDSSLPIKAQCFVFEERKGLWPTRVWKSNVISSEDDRPLVEPDLWAWPMTRHKIPELVFYSFFSSGSWNPSTMHVYRWINGTFQPILDTESACSHWIMQPHRNGRYQVRSLDLIGGFEMGHSGLVPWPQIYDWNGSRYVASEAQHPEEFRNARLEILHKLKRYPEDPELWKYLGYTYLYDHQRRLAFAAFGKAERAYRVQLQDKDLSVYAKEELRELAAARAGAGE